MGLDRQLEQLCTLYAEKSDTELLALHDRRDDLTDLAQEALAQVMKERGVSATGVPVEPDLPGPNAKTAMLAEDEVALPGLGDPIQVNEAIRLLTEAEISFRAVNYGESESGSGRSYRSETMLGLVVRKQDEEAATALLQAKMNLLPWFAEGGVAEGSGSRVMLGVYRRNDAAHVASALGKAALSYVWNDGRDDTSLEEDEVRIEVYAAHWDEAKSAAELALRG